MVLERRPGLHAYLLLTVTPTAVNDSLKVKYPPAEPGELLFWLVENQRSEIGGLRGLTGLDGVMLGPGYSPHDAIRRTGNGAY